MKTNLIQELNQAQMQAVTSHSQIIKVVAGAGSGKTRVLVSRILYLIEQGIYPHRICGITFTNKAANEMKHRILDAIADEGRAVWLSTIHALCVRILREEIELLQYPRNFTIVDANDQRSIVKEAYKQFEIDAKEFSISGMLAYISNNKSANIGVERAFELTGRYQDDVTKAKVYQFYQQQLQQMFGLDFDDLLLFTVKIFKQSANVLVKWQQRFDVLLVDEFQDIDQVQYTLIKQLAGTRNQLFVVGDPDQTIYTWRGADVNIILDFSHDFPQCETIFLNQNYRCTQPILKVANALIKHNKYRQEKELFTDNTSTVQPLLMSFHSSQAQADWIALQIEQCIMDKVPLNQIAILYRSNFLSRQLEKTLMFHNIPYVISGGVRFYDRLEIKDVLSYLRMCVIGDDWSFLRTINSPKRGIGEKSLEKLKQYAHQHGLSLYQVAQMDNPLTGKAKLGLMSYVQVIESLKNKSLELPLDKLIEAILDESGLKTYYLNNHEVERLENIKELMNDALSFVKSYEETTLEDYLATVALYGDKQDESLQAVSLMTIHAAKGLEFEVVFISDLTEGVFPNERAMTDYSRGIEEERRLAYVAITRAKRKLYLTYPQGFSFVLNQNQVPSRFIQEMDVELLVHKQLTHYGEMIEKKSLKDVKVQLTTKHKYKPGDVVVHTIFGEGIVVSVDQMTGKIAFNHPYGLKTLNLVHPALTKKEVKHA